MDLFACWGYQLSSLMYKTRNHSTLELSESNAPSIQTMIEEVKFVVFVKDELKYQDISILRALLPFLVNQDSNSVRKKFLWYLKTNSILQVKSYRVTPWCKIEAGIGGKTDFPYRRIQVWQHLEAFSLSDQSEFHCVENNHQQRFL